MKKSLKKAIQYNQNQNQNQKNYCVCDRDAQVYFSVYIWIINVPLFVARPVLLNSFFFFSTNRHVPQRLLSSKSFLIPQ